MQDPQSPARIGGLGAALRILKNGLRVGAESGRVLIPRAGISRRGFLGHDRDGGVERFLRLTVHLSEQELLDRLFTWERHRTVFLLAMLAAAGAIPVTGLYGYGEWRFVVGLCLLILFAFMKAVEADVSAWRIRQRRMAPLAEYLRHRLPGNLQIMDDR